MTLDTDGVLLCDLLKSTQVLNAEADPGVATHRALSVACRANRAH